jgi:excisionase family DNA binding protein
MSRTNGTSTGDTGSPLSIPEKLDRMITLLESLVDRSDTERLLTRDEAADVLNVSVRKLDALEEAGEIQAIRIGRSVRYHPEVLDRFIRRQAQRDG